MALFLSHRTGSACRAGVAVAAISTALLGMSTAQATATEIKPNPGQVSVSSGAGTQVRTSGVQGDVRTSGTQGDVRSNIKAVPGVRANPMPGPNSCNEVVSYTCD